MRIHGPGARRVALTCLTAQAIIDVIAVVPVAPAITVAHVQRLLLPAAALAALIGACTILTSVLIRTRGKSVAHLKNVTVTFFAAFTGICGWVMTGAELLTSAGVTIVLAAACVARA